MMPDHTADNAPPPISAELRTVYEATLYQVETPTVIVTIKVGELTPESLFIDNGDCRSIAVVSAFNPFSKKLPPAENLERHERLKRTVERAGYSSLCAVGRDLAGEWDPETSLAVFDATEAALGEWVVTYKQYAIVVGDRGAIVTLRFHPSIVS